MDMYHGDAGSCTHGHQTRGRTNTFKSLHSLKLFTARKINKHLSRNGALWQKGYTDWGIRTETVLNKTIRYCYTNPIRKGIVASSRDYPYWRCKFEME